MSLEIVYFLENNNTLCLCIEMVLQLCWYLTTRLICQDCCYLSPRSVNFSCRNTRKDFVESRLVMGGNIVSTTDHVLQRLLSYKRVLGLSLIPWQWCYRITKSNWCTGAVRIVNSCNFTSHTVTELDISSREI